jgi:CDP-diacylglycerol--glycerol-3-phosphate 3-phosphatidyltransferase
MKNVRIKAEKTVFTKNVSVNDGNIVGDNDSITKSFNRKDMITIPNLLTILRIFLAPFFMFAVLGGRYIIAFILLVIAALTDFFDGLIARKFNMQSEFGRMLDPIADKILVFCAVVALLLRFGFPLWLGIIIISRDLFILLAAVLFIILHKHSELKPNILGKISTFFQMTSLTVYIVASSFGYYESWIGILLYATAAMTVMSGLSYIVKGYRILKGE